MKSKIKIAYILLHLGDGGTEGFVYNLISQLDKSKYEISVILASNEENGFLDEKIKACGANIYKTVYVSGIKNRILHLNMVKKILQETGPYDVVHGNIDLFNGLELGVAKKVGVPIRICHSHNSRSQNANTLIRKVVFKFYKYFMQRQIYKNANIYLGCSELAMDYLYGDKWCNKNSEIIFNGINMRKFRDKNIDIDYYSNKLGIDKKKVNLLTVGRFVEQKNPFFIVEIINQLSKIRNDIVLNWVGEGELKEQIIKKVKEMNLEEKIKFYGTRDDVDEIMKCCNYFLLPSLFEGLVFVLIEAQAVGLECFVSDTIDKMTNCGKCITISLVDDSKVWANNINEYINSNKKMKINEELINKFDIKNTVKQVEKYYLSIN